MVFCQHEAVAVYAEHSALDKAFAEPAVGGISDGRNALATPAGVGEHHESLFCVVAAAVGRRAFAEQEFGFLAGLFDGDDWVEQRVAEGGQEGARSVKDFMAVGFERGRGVCATRVVAIGRSVPASPLRLLEAVPFEKQRMRLGQALRLRHEHQRALPEVLLLIVVREARWHVTGLADIDLGVLGVATSTHQEIDRNLAAFRHFEKIAEERTWNF